MITRFKIFEAINTFNLSKKQYDDILYQRECFDTIEDAEKELYSLINKYKKLEDTIKLYRVLFIKKGKNINENKLGIHWTDKEIDNTQIIRIRDANADYDETKKIFLITAIFNSYDINILKTLKNNMRYPTEKEVTVKLNSKPIDYTIEEID